MSRAEPTIGVVTRVALGAWLPVVAWAALIFALSSIPDLGTGLGGWDLALRKIAHAAEYAVLGALLLRAIGRELPAAAIGIAYAVTDEVHQAFVPGRQGPCSTCSSTPSACCSASTSSGRAARRASRETGAIVVDFDAVLGDTEPLWRAWLEDARRRYRVELEDDPDEAALDAAIGNWRPLLERFAEDHARVYLRPTRPRTQS